MALGVDAMMTDLFVGRAAELRLLESELERVRGGTPRLVIMEGPAGIGKSSLIRRFLAGAEGLQVLRASGDETECRLAFGVMSQLLAVSGIRCPDPHADPFTVGADFLTGLGELRVEAPLVLVVDDAHWADALSLQTLSFMLRRLLADQVLAVVVTRPDAPAIQGLRRVAAERGVTVLLEGLGSDELGELAARVGWSSLPKRSLQRLAEHTGGNPLFALGLLEELSPEALHDPSRPLPAPRRYAAGFGVTDRLSD